MENGESNLKKGPIILFKDSAGKPLFIKFPGTPNTVAKGFIHYINMKLHINMKLSDYVFDTLLDAIHHVYSMEIGTDGKIVYDNRDESDLYPDLLREWKAYLYWLSEPLSDVAPSYDSELRKKHESERLSHSEELKSTLNVLG